jgi:hypothetical protein
MSFVMVFLVAVSFPLVIISSLSFFIESFLACYSAFWAACISAHSAIIRLTMYPFFVVFVSASSSAICRAVGNPEIFQYGQQQLVFKILEHSGHIVWLPLILPKSLLEKHIILSDLVFFPASQPCLEVCHCSIFAHFTVQQTSFIIVG